MTVRDKNGKLLTSNNPVLIAMWKSAGYQEEKKKSTKKESAVRKEAEE